MRGPVLTLLLPLRGWDKACFSICNAAVLLRLGHPSSSHLLGRLMEEPQGCSPVGICTGDPQHHSRASSR